jgi:hypothetical protein
MQRARVSRNRKAAQTSTGSGADGAGSGDIATSSAVFSRPTSMPTVEKNSVTVKTLITDSMDDDLRKFAREHGFSATSDCLRELIRVALYGRAHVLSLHEQRINALARNLAESRTDSGQEERA